MEGNMTTLRSGSEFFLASLLKRPVINVRGREVGRLEDLVMVPGPRYPQVSHLVVKRAGNLFSVPWAEVSLFNPFVISVARQGEELSHYVPTEGDILMRRDILDKQIVDVNGARLLRVNDLKVGEVKDILCVYSVDVGFRGLLRRLGYERVGDALARLMRRRVPHQEIGWEYVSPVTERASRLALTVAREQLSELHPADIAQIVGQLSTREAESVLSSIDPEVAGEAIHELEPEMGSRVIEELDRELAVDILEEMSPDEAADVIGELTEEKAQELLKGMDREDAEDIQELLVHEKHTAGGLMNTDFIPLTAGMTVEEALTQVRLLAPDVETIYYAYVLDEDERLEGIVSLKALLTGRNDIPVTEIMKTNIKSVELDARPTEILRLIARYDLVALPVIDEGGRMAGIVTVEDVLEFALPGSARH